MLPFFVAICFEVESLTEEYHIIDITLVCFCVAFRMKYIRRCDSEKRQHRFILSTEESHNRLKNEMVLGRDSGGIFISKSTIALNI